MKQLTDYPLLLAQVRALTAGVPHQIANLSNIDRKSVV